MDSCVLIEKREHIALVTLNRPEKLNHEALLDRAFALAETILEKSPLAVAACLGIVTRGLNVPIDEALPIEAGYFARMVPTHDMREGITAWLARRKPQFTGR